MGATVDVLGDLIESKLIQPLNHSYIPNIHQAWPDFSNPYYDRGWQYTVPYTIYTTGIAWRKDKVRENPYAMANPWKEMFFQPQYKGKIAILDDYREGISLGLMMNGIYDLNTTSKAQIDLSRQTLLQLADAVDMQIDNNDYSEVPDGQTWIHHAWSGDMAAAPSYMPKGVPVEVVGYWFPKDGKGPIANDTNTVLRSASNPVLAHAFLNYLLDEPVVLENISWNGYMQPLTSITPELLVKEQILPPSLMSTAVCRRTSAAGSRSFSFRSTPTRSGSRPGSSRGTGSSMAHVPPEQLEHVPDSAARKRSRQQKQHQSNRWFWILLAAPGMIWLLILFVVPFYAVLAIGEGKLDRQTESPVAVYNPLTWSSANLSNVWHDLFGSGAFAARSPGGPSGTSWSPRCSAW